MKYSSTPSAFSSAAFFCASWRLPRGAMNTHQPALSSTCRCDNLAPRDSGASASLARTASTAENAPSSRHGVRAAADCGPGFSAAGFTDAGGAVRTVEGSTRSFSGAIWRACGRGSDCVSASEKKFAQAKNARLARTNNRNNALMRQRSWPALQAPGYPRSGTRCRGAVR